MERYTDQEEVLRLLSKGEWNSARAEVDQAFSESSLLRGVITLLLSGEFQEAVIQLRSFYDKEPSHPLIPSVIRTIRNLTSTVMNLNAPLLVSNRLKLVHFHIPRNGSISTSCWMLDNDTPDVRAARDAAIAANTYSTPAFRSKYLSMINAIHLLGESPINRSDFLKFAVVRNPWDRLFSGFRGKFIYGDGRQWVGKDNHEIEIAYFAKQVEMVVRKRHPAPGKTGLSFREFVEYVCSHRDEQMDCHWQSQTHLCAGNHQPDVVCRFERLSEDFGPILAHVRQLGISPTPAPYTPKRRTLSGDFGPPGSLADLDTRALRQLDDQKLHMVDFYTPDLIEAVGIRYRDDIINFGYGFDD